MKKIINDTENIVNEMIEGMIKAFSDKLERIENTDVIIRKDRKKDKVAIISGGGSGHEPAHAGYVGYGMLDCAVCGEVFTSPTPDQVYEAIKNADCGKGVFLIIKNYTGDVMNFDMAKEMAEAEGIKVDYIVVNDDVAVEDSTYTTGRRGICGTILFHKILGAMAEDSKSLEEIKECAENLVKNIKSMGMAIKPCTIASVGKENFHLEDDEMEIGIGIHGEPGIKREKIKTANEITKELTDKILSEFDDLSEVLVIVNGMGQTPEMELFIVNNFLHDYLTDKDIKIYKSMVGNYMTSLDMAGFSITILKLNEEFKKYLDYKADTICLKEL
ncbi:MAG: dihydroxyacetone kinase subunit DhaK [Tissierellia bacterium]|nr:dihydroxyacetone kinase subunit DhaK [Tissierellia bacterium]